MDFPSKRGIAIPATGRKILIRQKGNRGMYINQNQYGRSYQGGQRVGFSQGYNNKETCFSFHPVSAFSPPPEGAWFCSRSADRAEEKQAPEVAAAGADLIIGAHPHCLQQIGVVQGVPVMYSLGNFWFNSKIDRSSRFLQIPARTHISDSGFLQCTHGIQKSRLPVIIRMVIGKGHQIHAQIFQIGCGGSPGWIIRIPEGRRKPRQECSGAGTVTICWRLCGRQRKTVIS